MVCNVQSDGLGPETNPSLPGLACPGWRNRPGLVAPNSPFPLLTALGLLLETITGIHKGLSNKVQFQGELGRSLGFFFVIMQGWGQTKMSHAIHILGE